LTVLCAILYLFDYHTESSGQNTQTPRVLIRPLSVATVLRETNLTFPPPERAFESFITLYPPLLYSRYVAIQQARPGSEPHPLRQEPCLRH
jgi:hypothetical protein